MTDIKLKKKMHVGHWVIVIFVIAPLASYFLIADGYNWLRNRWYGFVNWFTYWTGW